MVAVGLEVAVPVGLVGAACTQARAESDCGDCNFMVLPTPSNAASDGAMACQCSCHWTRNFLCNRKDESDTLAAVVEHTEWKEEPTAAADCRDRAGGAVQVGGAM